MATDAFLWTSSDASVGGSISLALGYYAIPFVLGISLSFFVVFDTLRVVRS